MTVRILYVEDEPDIREIATLALEIMGDFEVFGCESGAVAITTAASQAVDLVILDVMMPHMDGPATLAALRRLPAFATTPIVFMTAKAQPQEIAQLIALGAVDVIAKPFDPQSLACQITSIVEAHRARDPERLRQRLEVLRQIFIAQLPERLGAISAQYRAVLDAGFDDETLHALCLAAHSLKGSAATYGYTPTSAAAGRLEAAINALMARDRDDRRSAADSLHLLLETLAGSAGTAEGPRPDLPAADEDMIALKESARTEKSVYMLEDDILLRDLLSVQLGHYGYHVHAFAEAEAFRAAVIRQAPDAMIIDIMMAESDTAGLDILADLRKRGDTPARHRRHRACRPQCPSQRGARRRRRLFHQARRPDRTGRDARSADPGRAADALSHSHRR